MTWSKDRFIRQAVVHSIADYVQVFERLWPVPGVPWVTRPSMLGISEILPPSICHIHIHARDATVQSFPNARLRYDALSMIEA